MAEYGISLRRLLQRWRSCGFGGGPRADGGRMRSAIMMIPRTVDVAGCVHGFWLGGFDFAVFALDGNHACFSGGGVE